MRFRNDEIYVVHNGERYLRFKVYDDVVVMLAASRVEMSRTEQSRPLHRTVPTETALYHAEIEPVATNSHFENTLFFFRRAGLFQQESRDTSNSTLACGADMVRLTCSHATSHDT